MPGSTCRFTRGAEALSCGRPQLRPRPGDRQLTAPAYKISHLIARPDVRAALDAWLEEEGTLIDAAAARPDAWPLHGRGRVLVVPAPGGAERWVVRHYHRGGAVASLLGDRYLRVGTPRPFQEFRTGRALEELEVPTVPHLGAAVYPSGPWYRGDLVTRYVPDSRDLAGVLFPGAGQDVRAERGSASTAGGVGDPAVVGPASRAAGVGEPAPDAAEAMAATGSLIRLLHDRGVHHPDLNLKNVLIAGEGAELRALVLDLDRARILNRLSERAGRRMLERFWRSARKWEAAVGQRLEAELREAFREGYDSA